MVREVLVSDMLTEDMVRAGRELIEGMDRSPLDGSLIRYIDAAFWAKGMVDGSSRWRLYIFSPGVSFAGPRSGYRWAHDALARISEQGGRPVVPFEHVVMNDTNSDALDALRATFKRIDNVENYRSTDLALGSSYFEEIFIYRLDRTTRIECVVRSTELFARLRKKGHVFVFGKDLMRAPEFAVIGHGRLKANGELRVDIELPVKYGITSADQVVCEPFLPMAAGFEGQEPEWTISNILLTPAVS